MGILLIGLLMISGLMLGALGSYRLQHAAGLLLDDPAGRDLFVLDTEGRVPAVGQAAPHTQPA